MGSRRVLIWLLLVGFGASTMGIACSLNRCWVLRGDPWVVDLHHAGVLFANAGFYGLEQRLEGNLDLFENDLISFIAWENSISNDFEAALRSTFSRLHGQDNHRDAMMKRMPFLPFEPGQAFDVEELLWHELGRDLEYFAEDIGRMMKNLEGGFDEDWGHEHFEWSQTERVVNWLAREQRWVLSCARAGSKIKPIGERIVRRAEKGAPEIDADYEELNAALTEVADRHKAMAEHVRVGKAELENWRTSKPKPRKPRWWTSRTSWGFSWRPRVIDYSSLRAIVPFQRAVIIPLWIPGGVCGGILCVLCIVPAHRRRRRRKAGRCEECGYMLRGLRGQRCPECGAEFKPWSVSGLPPPYTTDDPR